MMADPIPTVRILHPDHPDGILINEDDLEPEHVLVDAKAEKARRKAEAAAVRSEEGALAAIKERVIEDGAL